MKKLKEANILVTGGLGYLGSHTVIELLKCGYQVTIIDNLANSRIETLELIYQLTNQRPDFWQIDLCQQTELSNFFAKAPEISGVIHFAGLKSVTESLTDPLKYYQVNLSGLLNLLQEMKSAAINNLIFSSSCSVYGEPFDLPLKENTPLNQAKSPYALTKKNGEELLRNFCQNSKFKALALRYCNPAGADHSGLIGENSLFASKSLIPIISEIVTGERKNLKVNGNDYDTPDGTCLRDYIHISDLAEAHVYALAYLFRNQSSGFFDVFNIGTGKSYSVLEVINSFKKFSKKKIAFSFTERRPGDIAKIVIDPEYAREKLGWQARRSLEQIIESTLLWEKQKKTVLEGTVKNYGYN